MKRKILATIFGVTCAISMACFAGCNLPEPDSGHTHSYTETVTQPTCTEQGYTTHTCECGESYKDNYVNALGHSFTDYISDNNATCEQDGTKTATCNNGCGETDTQVDLNTKGHKFTNYVSNNDATLEQDGTKTATCDNGCGAIDSITDEGSKKDILKYFIFAEYGEGYEITKYVGEDNNVVIPERYNSKPILSIGDEAFKEYSSLQNIEIPDSIEYIGDNAFPETTTLIYNEYDNAFYLGNAGNPYLALVKTKSFDITNCEINNKCKFILGGYNIRLGGTTLGFAMCSSLQSIEIPDSVKNIGHSVFHGCVNLQYNEYDNGYYLGNENNPYLALIKAKSTEITSCEINENCKLITDYAFYGCGSLQSIEIPDSVQSIGERVFFNCTSLTSIMVQEDNAYYCSEDGVLYNKNKTELICYPAGKTQTTFTIPNTVQRIGSYAFSGCDSLQDIVIPDGVQGIGDYAFDSCDNLQSVTIGNSVQSIGNSAFSGCSSLQYNEYDNGYYLGNENNKYLVLVKANSTFITSCEINDNCRFILDNAFYGCGSLQSIEIPDSVQSIGNSAFFGCSSLQSIEIPDSVQSIGRYVFDGCHKLIEVINKSSLNIVAGSSDYGYVGYYAKQIIAAESQSKIIKQGDYSFYNDNGTYYLISYNGSKTNLVLPEDINENYYSIYQYVFYNNDSIQSIEIPDSVQSIGFEAFYKCSSLQSVTIGNSVQSIGDYAFSSCDNLQSITIPDSVKSIGSSAFSHCTSLQSITIGNGVQSIGDDAFSYCNSLQSIEISDSVQSIGYGAFSYCNSLQSVTIGNGVQSIGDYAFTCCYNLQSVTIGNGVQSIGEEVFYNCSSLQSIEIPDSVQSIGDYAFFSCDNLQSVTIGNSVQSIGNYAFEDCYSLQTINYSGTKAEWLAIEKDSGWANRTGDFTVVCTDGSLTKAEATA